MTRLSGEQRGVRSGMILAGLASLAVILGGVWLVPVPDAATVVERLDWLLPWFAVLALPLAFAVAAIAAHRFFHPGVIDGSNDPDDLTLAVSRAFLQNTLEQTVLASLALLALPALLPSAWLGALPAAILWFVVARIAFRATYAKGAAARSFGFAATFYPSVAGLAVAVVLLAAR